MKPMGFNVAYPNYYSPTPSTDLAIAANINPSPPLNAYQDFIFPTNGGTDFTYITDVKPTEIIILTSPNTHLPAASFKPYTGSLPPNITSRPAQLWSADFSIPSLPIAFGQNNPDMAGKHNFPATPSVISIIPKGLASVDMFTPSSIRLFKQAGCLRFMDWALTNNATQTARPLPSSSWTVLQAGVPVEYMVALCNASNSDMWLTIPHTWSNDSVVSAIAYCHSALAPALKLYVEYSNEVWNTSFTQAQLAATQTGGADVWYGQQSAALAKMISAVSNRPQLVLCNQWGAGSRRIKISVDAYIAAGGPKWMLKAIGCAPYVSVPDMAKMNTYATNNDFASQIADLAAYQKQYEYILADWGAYAKSIGVEFVLYEYGSQLVTHLDVPRKTVEAPFLEKIAHSPEMAAINARNVDAFRAAGGNFGCFYNSVGVGSGYGFWGVTPSYEDRNGYPFLNMWREDNVLALRGAG